MSTLPESFLADKRQQYRDFLVILRWSAAIVAIVLAGLVSVFG